jgi:hypothetical protein
MKMSNSSFADFITSWDHLVSAIEDNIGELAQLEQQKIQLGEIVANAKMLDGRQDSLRADLTQTTKDLNSRIREGKDLATRLRNGVRAHYGNANEKLTAFRIRPFRGRSRQEGTAGGSTPPPPTIE